MERQKRWAETLSRLLDQLDEDELNLEDYQGAGNDKAIKDQIKPILNRFVKMVVKISIVAY